MGIERKTDRVSYIEAPLLKIISGDLDPGSIKNTRTLFKKITKLHYIIYRLTLLKYLKHPFFFKCHIDNLESPKNFKNIRNNPLNV